MPALPMAAPKPACGFAPLSRGDRKWRHWEKREFQRHWWLLLLISFAPIPPILILLAAAVHRHKRACVPMFYDDALAILFVAVACWLWSELENIKKAARLEPIAPSDLRSISIIVCAGVFAYAGLALYCFGDFCSAETR